MPDPPSLLGDSPGARHVTPGSGYIQPNLGHGLRIWWALFWRTTLDSSISYSGPVLAFHLVLPSYWSYTVNYAVTLAMMYFILRKRFRGFQIRLVSRSDRTQVLQPTFRRTFRIWWTFAWRTLVYRIVLSFAMSVPMGFLSGAVAVIYPPLGRAFAVFAGLVIEAGVGLFTIYSSILDEDIGDFCVTLVPVRGAEPVRNAVTAHPPTGA
jgi:hypothetical protein